MILKKRDNVNLVDKDIDRLQKAIKNGVLNSRGDRLVGYFTKSGDYRVIKVKLNRVKK